MDVPEFKNRIWDLLRGVTEEMDRLFRPIAEEQGLTLMRARLLFAVAAHRRPSVSSLGQEVGITSGNMSALCKKLEGEGFLQRERDGLDERVVHVTLTPRGAAVVEALSRRMQEQYAQSLDAVEECELEQIMNGLQTLGRLLKRFERKEHSDGETQSK